MNPIAPANDAIALLHLGAQIRARRKALRVNSTAAAEAAGVSRVTLHRIEKGVPTVAISAWARVMGALGLVFEAKVEGESWAHQPADAGAWIPAQIRLINYPQLKALAWHVQGTETLRPREAFDIYEGNVRHLQTDLMQPAERDLLRALRIAFGDLGDV